ncbi:MAG: sigma-54 dependent transcriptional regulator [Sedimenticola sp.]
MPIDINPVFSILLVDDEIPWLRSLGITLEGPGGFTNLMQTQDSREVMGLLAQHDIGIVILDLTMPHISGDELLKKIKQDFPAVQVIVLSGMNKLEIAVGCMRQGAFDYFVKTDGERRLLDGVRRAVCLVELQRENQEIRHKLLTRKLERPDIFTEIITHDAAMLAIFTYLESISASRYPLLILGESGVGKELIARAAHKLANNSGPLISVNVAGLDDDVFADTLFGHLKGAFTGAERKRCGMVERAAGGTLFLDEIGDLSSASQVKLLRLLQEGEFYSLGSDTPSQSHARVVCATHRNLVEAVAQGKFRKDLYYRLYAHQVEIPPLRERYEDIPFLLEYFLKTAASEFNKLVPTPPRELIALLGSYSFPGNLRELQTMVQDAVSQHQGGVLSMATFLDRVGASRKQLLPGSVNPFIDLDELPTLSHANELLVDVALERGKGNQSLAARMLGISQPALSKRLKHRREIDAKGV